MPAAVSTRLAARRPIAHPPTAGRLRRALATRVLILSWEYPPIVEGGLARHVAKLAEALVAEGVAVTVLTRGRVRDLPQEVRAGVRVHRVPEPRKPRDLDAFVEWVEAWTRTCSTPGARSRARPRSTSSTATTGSSPRPRRASRTSSSCPYVTTVHATEHGRHQGWVDKHPQAHIHGVEAWMAQRADRVIVCSSYMRDHVADVFGVPDGRVEVIPNGIDPADLAVRRRPRRAARALRGARGASSSCSSGAWSTRRASSSRSTRSSRVIARRRRRALPGRRGPAPTRPSSRRRPGAWGSRGTARSWAGSATTSSTRSTASPT